MTNGEQAQLEEWRAVMLSDLKGSDVGAATTALLALTYDDPDRRQVEVILLHCLAPGTEAQLRALAVTCVGHVGRIHGAVSADLKCKLQELLDDPILGGRAEDALDDLKSFISDTITPGC